MEIYLARQNSDLTEGRGTMVTRGAFLDHDSAKRCAADLDGIMGSRQGVDVATMVVFNSYEEWRRGRDNDLRQRALNKLSAEERKALGF